MLDLRTLAVSVVVLGFAASPATAATPKPALENARIAQAIQKELSQRKSISFEPLLRSWEERFGAAAVPPLLSLASDRAKADADRFVALMSAAKLGGHAVASQVARYLDDRSWMLRSGALQALSALDAKKEGHRALALLKDPALVVRMEAVRTAAKLRPEGTVDALIASLEDPRNYHGGKAQWVPHAALDALASLKATRAQPKILPLLSRTEDERLLESAVRALDQLNGKPLTIDDPLPARVALWKRHLQARAR